MKLDPKRAVLAILAALWLALATVLPAAAQAQTGTPAQTQAPAGGPQSDVASYQIQVTLDPTTKQLHGSERITYRNPSPDTLQEIWVHLYLNAFRSADTQWMREAGGEHRGFSASAPGWIKVEQFSLADSGTPLPLPGGGDTEETNVRVPLPTPLGPGKTLALDVRWTAQLPRVFARTGYAGDFFMAGQWYPKLAVYDRGHWDTEPWHANAEFFADFGNYDLAVTVPANYVTGASGVRAGETDNGNGTKTVRYRAERVTDVAWTAWPDYRVFTREVPIGSSQVQVEVLLPPDEAGNASRHLDAAQAALENYSAWYGAYPWPKLTVVVPPEDAGGAGGMEYPSLVTTGTNAPIPPGLPVLAQGVHMLEIVTVHEIAHEWFPMQVQSNEGAEAWLDEGFADYLTTRLLGRLYGFDSSVMDLAGLRQGYAEMMRGEAKALDVSREPLATPAWQFPSFNAYVATVYGKGSLTLLSLERLFGDERFTAALRHYADTWRWRHPTSADLQAALSESLGENLDWFFGAFVFGRDVVAYRVASLDAAKAVVERVGEVPYPVDVRLTFADGTSRTQVWDGADQRLTLDGSGRPINAVAIDPDERIALEMDRLDNARVLQPDATPAFALAGRWLAFVQLLLQLFGQVG